MMLCSCLTLGLDDRVMLASVGSGGRFSALDLLSFVEVQVMSSEDADFPLVLVVFRMNAVFRFQFS